MANELDELMSLDPLEMSSRDIDAIIAYHRKARANAEAGIKPVKESGPKVSLTGSFLDRIIPAKAPTVGKPGLRRI